MAKSSSIIAPPTQQNVYQQRQGPFSFPDTRQPIPKQQSPFRTTLIFSIAGICFLLFLSAVVSFLLQIIGPTTVSVSNPVLNPPQVSPNTSKIALILPPEDVSKCVPKRIDQEQASVIAVLSGDSIDVKFADGSTHRVHYIGISPDGEPEHLANATSMNAQLVEGKEVILIRDVTNQDNLGRLQRYVFTGEIFVNYELLAQGWVNLESFPPDTSCSDDFRRAQQQAASSRLGIWGGSESVSQTIP